MKKKKVMIADDEQDILHFMKYFLESAGYEVYQSVNGTDLLNLNENELPDLFLLDLWMSGIDGADICKRLKSQAGSRHIPVIIISAHPDIAQICTECGADACIAKPFDANYLLNEVKKHLEGGEVNEARRMAS